MPSSPRWWHREVVIPEPTDVIIPTLMTQRGSDTRTYWCHHLTRYWQRVMAQEHTDAGILHAADIESQWHQCKRISPSPRCWHRKSVRPEHTDATIPTLLTQKVSETRTYGCHHPSRCWQRRSVRPEHTDAIIPHVAVCVCVTSHLLQVCTSWNTWTPICCRLGDVPKSSLFWVQIIENTSISVSLCQRNKSLVVEFPRQSISSNVSSYIVGAS